jgi:hypothetical protein
MPYHQQKYEHKRNLSTGLYISIPAQHNSFGRIVEHSFQHMCSVTLPQDGIATLQQIKFVMHDRTNQVSVWKCDPEFENI